MYKKKKKARVGQQEAPRRVKTQDAFSNALARLGFGTPNLLEGTQYQLQRLTRDYATLNALYRESWIVRRIIDIIPADMLKNWITITSDIKPELLKRFDVELRKTQLRPKLQLGLQWARLYGGAIGVMLIKGQGDDLSTPLDLEQMVPGDFKGLLIFDRWNGVSPSGELVSDIDDPEYGLPKYYSVSDPSNGVLVKIHHSRCIRFVGNPLPFWEQLAEIYWGASVIESVFDELRKRDNVSWNIAQLTFMANLRVLKMSDLGQMLASTDQNSQKELYQTLSAQNMLMSNMGIQVMDAADGLETHQYTFGGLADCYEQFIMDIAGAAEIPVTKLFGRSPSGMNATGESDLQNYYEMIATRQGAELRPILNKLLPVLCMSILGSVPDDIDFDFNPVAEPTDKERTELAKSGTDIVVAAINAGLVSPRTGLKELKQQSERTGVWTNITDEDIEKASDEIEQGEMGGFPGMGEFEEEEPELPEEMTERMGAADAEWDESKHPRRANGQFGRGGGNNLQKGGKGGNIHITQGEIDQIRAQFGKPKTSDDRQIAFVTKHACIRIKTRELSIAELKKILATQKPTPGNKANTVCYEDSKVRIVVDNQGNLMTAMWRNRWE